jgi:hypothetical protein
MIYCYPLSSVGFEYPAPNPQAQILLSLRAPCPEIDPIRYGGRILAYIIDHSSHLDCTYHTRHAPSCVKIGANGSYFGANGEKLPFTPK